jgi:WD40 repeat protein
MRSFILLLCLSMAFHVKSQSLETIIQKGHELAVISVAVSPDSNFVATGSKDKSIKLWELSTGREVKSFLGHEMSVTALDFSSDGKLLLSGSNDKTVKLWDIISGKELFTLETGEYVNDVALDPNLKFFVEAGERQDGYGDHATIYDFKTRKQITQIPVNTKVSVDISADGKHIGFGEDNRIVNIYSTSTWEKEHNFTYEEGWCGGCATLICFSADNKFAYMASHNGPVKKYDLTNNKLLKVYEEKPDDLSGLAISNDGKKLARATDESVIVWDATTGQQLDSISAKNEGAFHEIAFTQDSKRLIITSDKNIALVWNINSHKKEKELTGFLNQRDKGGITYDANFYWESAIAKYLRLKNYLLITNDGKTLIKGKFGTKIKRWDISSGKAEMEYVGHAKAALCYELSKDGKRMISGDGDGMIILWNTQTGDTISTIKSYREPIFDIHFNNDETKILSSSWDATMKIHDLASGKLLTYFDFENSSAYNAIFHPNDLYVFTSRLDNSLQMWELDTKTAVRSFVGHKDVISSIHLNADNKTLLSASWDGSIRLWDVGTGLMDKKLTGHRGAVHTAIFSNDGKFVYSAGADRIIRVWDLSNSNVIKTFVGHKAEITSLLFSPDNKMLISHGVDGVTKFWDLNSGKEFFEHIHLGETDWLVKNPEGYFNGTDNARKYVHFVDGLKTYSIDQFFDEFYRPDLLPKIFQNRGGSDDLKGIQGKLKDSPPPTVNVAVVSTGQGKADVFVRVIDNGAGARGLKLFHNGKNIQISNDMKMPAGKGEKATYKHSIELVGGINTFTASASNKDNVESDQQSAEIFSEHASKSSTCYVLSVGINNYKNPRMTLNYAKPDAEAFTKTLDDRSKNLFKHVELITLYDEEATRAKILSTLEDLATKISQEDVFIFYYAGHGSMVDDKFYFIPTESSRLYDASALNKEALEAGLLQEKFKHIKALKQLIVMDACQSGGSVELLATRGASEEKAIAQLSRSAGIHVMASAGSEQFATEFAELGHGLFTYVLIKALQGEADGAPKDGKVTIYELKSYIDDQVPEMTRKLKGKPQYPYTFSRGQDFPVVTGE